MPGNTCCFIGHRDINETEQLKSSLIGIIEKMILNENVDTFLFGSKSDFNSLCLDIVTETKEKYPNIKRVYVRSQYPCVEGDYLDYLLTFYDDTYYPERIKRAGKSVYVERNYEMIDNSRFCVFYYKPKNILATRKSGTKIAYEYAVKNKKEIFILPKEI